MSGTNHPHLSTSTDSPQLSVSLVEEMVFTSPPGMEGWRAYRIEYGGHAQECIIEGGIWLPPAGDPAVIEEMLELWWQEEATDE